MSSMAGTAAGSEEGGGTAAIAVTVLRGDGLCNPRVAFWMHFVTSLVLHHGPAGDDCAREVAPLTLSQLADQAGISLTPVACRLPYQEIEMNFAKTLTATATAAALVGALSLAYAQTGDGTGTTGAGAATGSSTQLQNQPSTGSSTAVPPVSSGTTMDNSANTTPSTTPSTSSSDMGVTERTAQADRG
jgi:hypothetical protein